VPALLVALALVAGAQVLPVAAQTPPPPAVGGDPRVDPSRFRVTTFAAGLNFPYGLDQLADGSLLVGTSRPPAGGGGYFASSGELRRFRDADLDGVADDPVGAVLYTGLPGSLTAVRRAGSLVLVSTSSGVTSFITVLRRGLTPAAPYTRLGSIDLTFTPTWWHQSYALAVRQVPGDATRHEVFFNVAPSGNDTQPGTVGVSFDGLAGLAPSQLAGASIYRVTIEDTAAPPVLSGLVKVASGLRNAAGITLHPTTGDLWLADNGIDGLVDGNEPHSVDELNRIAVADIGGPVEDFGFPGDYVRYRTGVRVGSGGIQPVVAFQPLASAGESEGPAEIAFAPSGFPPGLDDGIFVGFHGKFNVGGLANEENPLVFVDQATRAYFHFVGNGEPAVGHLDGLLSTDDSLFVTDMSSSGGIVSPSDAGSGVIYQVKAVPGERAVLAGATFLADGTSARSGPPARIALFATGAEPGFAYQLVSGRDGGRNDPCSTDVVPLSGAVKYANASGVIGSTAGVLERPPGPWQVCFRSIGPGLRTVAAAVTYTVS